MPKAIYRLPAFRTSQESAYEGFKKQYKLLFLWSCLQWGALLIQSAFQIGEDSRIDTDHLKVEISIFVIFLVAWVLFSSFVLLCVRSYKWFRFFDLSALLGSLLITAVSLWRAKSGELHHHGDTEASSINFLLQFAEISFNLSCFLFLPRRESVRIVCFLIYILHHIFVAMVVDLKVEIAEAIRSVLFYGISAFAFGFLSWSVHRGHKVQLEEQKEFWRLSFEMIPHGIAIFERDATLIYYNQSLKKVLRKEDEFESPSVSQPKEKTVEKILQLQIALRPNVTSQQYLDGHTINNLDMVYQNETPVIQLEFKDFLTQHVSQKDLYVPIFADSTIGRKSIEIKAQRSHFKGHGDFFMVIFVDVTYRDKLAQLEDQNGFKDLLFKSVSHELRGPLNGSMMSISSLLTQDFPKDYKEVLSVSLVCQRRLLKSIDGILDLVKIGSKQFTPLLQMFDLKEVIRNSMEFFEDIMKKKGISAKLDIFSERLSPAILFSDPERLEQILYQLLDNAIKFTSPHGNLLFSAKILSMGPASQEDKVEEVEIIIEDSGCGLTREQIAKIYAASSTGFKSRISENSTGAGLGLSIVTQLLRKLGSELKIESEVSKGSRFSFRLKNFQTVMLHSFDQIGHSNQLEDSPMIVRTHNSLLRVDSSSFQIELEKSRTIDLREKLNTFTPSPAKLLFKRQTVELMSPVQITRFSSDNLFAGIPKEKTKMLVVDDDAFNIFALKRILTQIDYEVITAYNGKEAIEMLKIHHSTVGMVFMDLNMPVMDGYSATRELKKLMGEKKLSKIPIIACTAYAQESERSTCLEIGFDDFLTKPINTKKLEEIIHRYGNKAE